MRIHAQAITLNTPVLEWNDSFRLEKDHYIFHRMSASDTALYIEAEGNKNFYSFTLQNGQLYKKVQPKSKNETWLYQGQGAYGLRIITRKHLTRNLHQVIYKEDNSSEIEIFTFKESGELKSNIQIIDADSMVHVLVIPAGKFSDSARILHASITPTGEINRHQHGLGQLSRLTEVIQFNVHHHEAEFLLKSYRINKIEKRAFSRNYQYQLLQIDLPKATSNWFTLPLLDSLYYPKIKYSPSAKEFFGTYGHHPSNKVKGIFTVKWGDSLMNHYPFDPMTIKSSRRKTEFWRQKQILALHPDMIWTHGYNRYYFFEQFYIKMVGGSVNNPFLNFYYNNLIIGLGSSNSLKMKFLVIPKYQKTFHDFGQFSSYQVLKSPTGFGILFNSSPMYLQRPFRMYNNQQIRNSYFSWLSTDTDQIIKLGNDPILTGMIISSGPGVYKILSYRKNQLKSGTLKLN